jgi:hypothetical protein
MATTYNNFFNDEHDKKLKMKERKIYAFFLSTRVNAECKSFEIIERKSNKLGNVYMALDSRALALLLSLDFRMITFDSFFKKKERRRVEEDRDRLSIKN